VGIVSAVHSLCHEPVQVVLEVTWLCHDASTGGNWGHMTASWCQCW